MITDKEYMMLRAEWKNITHRHKYRYRQALGSRRYTK